MSWQLSCLWFPPLLLVRRSSCTLTCPFSQIVALNICCFRRPRTADAAQILLKMLQASRIRSETILYSVVRCSVKEGVLTHFSFYSWKGRLGPTSAGVRQCSKRVIRLISSFEWREALLKAQILWRLCSGSGTVEPVLEG
jgi:hypothetical protein